MKCWLCQSDSFVRAWVCAWFSRGVQGLVRFDHTFGPVEPVVYLCMHVCVLCSCRLTVVLIRVGWCKMDVTDVNNSLYIRSADVTLRPLLSTEVQAHSRGLPHVLLDQ